jgi:predicted MFS family arabinose efflux permease
MHMVGIGCFLTCLGLGLTAFGTSFFFAVLTIANWSFGEMLSLPLLNVVVANRAVPGNRGRYMGIYTMVFGIAFVVSPAAGTWVYDRLGAVTLWAAIGLLGVPLWLGSVWIGRVLARETLPGEGFRRMPS